MLPVSLYIHIPWCIRKCPYCDFNSHAVKNEIPEQDYINALLKDLEQETTQREFHSLFIGGGTPSLFSGEAIAQLLSTVHAPEITLEANPGTVEQSRFSAYFDHGINRISIGIQSFNDQHLKTLGRIHNSEEGKRAVDTAHRAGFTNYNLDLMYGLPNQSLSEALDDLQRAIDLNPTHLSWYQLTLEPNTVFYKKRPTLPEHDEIWEMQRQGQALLKQQGFINYEISAYAKKGYECQHNLNYWTFGDYIGIGAGAHGKITNHSHHITRTQKVKTPKVYLDPNKSFIQQKQRIPTKDIPFEYMLNHLRLHQPIQLKHFTQHTGLSIEDIKSTLEKAKEQNLIHYNKQSICLTELGRNFVNEVIELFAL